jgi:hypothetical protein
MWPMNVDDFMKPEPPFSFFLVIVKDKLLTPMKKRHFISTHGLRVILESTMPSPFIISRAFFHSIAFVAISFGACVAFQSRKTLAFSMIAQAQRYPANRSMFSRMESNKEVDMPIYMFPME